MLYLNSSRFGKPSTAPHRQSEGRRCQHLPLVRRDRRIACSLCRLPGQPHMLPRSHQSSVNKHCSQVLSASSASILEALTLLHLSEVSCRLCPPCRDLRWSRARSSRLGGSKVFASRVHAACSGFYLKDALPMVSIATSKIPSPMS